MKVLKKFKKIFIIVIVIAIVLIGLTLLSDNKDNNSNVIVNDYTASLGTIDSTISGKAIIQPNDQYTITTSVSGDILATYLEEGDVVKEDAIMFEIDSSDISIFYFNINYKCNTQSGTRLAYEYAVSKNKKILNMY